VKEIMPNVCSERHRRLALILLHPDLSDPKRQKTK